MGRIIANLEEDGLNANADTATASIEIAFDKTVAYGVEVSSGSIAAATFALQESMDNTNWYDAPASTLTGIGIVDDLETAVHYIRVKVETLAGTACSVDVKILAKP